MLDCVIDKNLNSYHHSSFYRIDVTNRVLSDPLVYRLWGQGSRGSLNEEQKLAISGALRSDVYLIQGPPGNNTICAQFLWDETFTDRQISQILWLPL